MNRGAKALRRAIDKKKTTQGKVIRKLGLPTGSLARLISGERKPGLALAIKLRRELDIPVEWWLETVDDESEEPRAA